MADKFYMETKKGTLEQSVLDVWKDAAEAQTETVAPPRSHGRVDVTTSVYAKRAKEIERRMEKELQRRKAAKTKKIAPFKGEFDPTEETEHGAGEHAFELGTDRYANYTSSITPGQMESVDLDEAVHWQARTKDGKGLFQIVDRDTKGMAGKQDKFKMQIVDKRGKVIKDLGSHVSVDSAREFARNRKIVDPKDLGQQMPYDPKRDKGKGFTTEGTWNLPKSQNEIAPLKKLMKKPIKLGKNGDDAIKTIEKYIGDDELFDDINIAGKKNPTGDARPSIKKAFKRLGIDRWIGEEVDFYEEIAELNALVEELDEGISQAIGRAGLAVAKTAGTAAKSAITKRLKRGPTAQLYRRAQAGIKKAKAVGSRIKQAAKTGQSYQSTAPVRKTKKPPKVKKAEYDPMLEKLEIIEFKLNHHCQTLEEEMKNESLKDAVIRVWQEAADAAVDPKEREELDNAPEDTAKKMKRADEPTPAVSEALIDAVSEALTAKQKKIDVDGDGEIEGSDLAALRKKAAKKEGLEDSPNPANSQHLCAKNVVHEEWGAGECIPTMHADPDKNGHVAWYDVIFEHGLEMGVSINELKVTHEGHHENHKKNDKDKEMLRAKKEEQDLMDGGPSHRQIYRRQQGMDRYSKKALKRREKGKKTRGFTQASRDRRDQAADARVKHLKVKADRKAAKIQAKTAKKEEVELDEFVLEAVSMMWFANVALPVLIGGGLVVAGGIGLGVMKLISKLSSMKAALKDKRMQKFIKDNKGKKKLDASDKAELNSIVSPAEKKKLKSEVEDVVKKEEFRLAQDFKVQSMREALRKVWNIDEGELPPALKKAIDAKKKDKEEDHDPEHDKDKEKTLTGKKKAAVNVNPSLQAQKY